MPNTTSWRSHLDGASSCRDPREPHGGPLACAAFWRSAEEMLPRLRSGTSSASERWQVVEVVLRGGVGRGLQELPSMEIPLRTPLSSGYFAKEGKSKGLQGKPRCEGRHRSRGSASLRGRARLANDPPRGHLVGRLATTRLIASRGRAPGFAPGALLVPGRRDRRGPTGERQPVRPAVTRRRSTEGRRQCRSGARRPWSSRTW